MGASVGCASVGCASPRRFEFKPDKVIDARHIVCWTATQSGQSAQVTPDNTQHPVVAIASQAGIQPGIRDLCCQRFHLRRLVLVQAFRPLRVAVQHTVGKKAAVTHMRFAELA